MSLCLSLVKGCRVSDYLLEFLEKILKGVIIFGVPAIVFNLLFGFYGEKLLEFEPLTITALVLYAIAAFYLAFISFLFLDTNLSLTKIVTKSISLVHQNIATMLKFISIRIIVSFSLLLGILFIQGALQFLLMIVYAFIVGPIFILGLARIYTDLSN
ncbi:hypothetical protein PRVXT_000254 [Proteinivorax tanatarense]|uniref:Uncharacterized protein n=1 Tax=Proteinivorax tanatarense TaxID=1260629 RepID=A0AAU7VN11_9FIRM